MTHGTVPADAQAIRAADPPPTPGTSADIADAGMGFDFDLDVSTVPIGETPASRRIVDSATYTCSTQSCCTTNACH